MKTAIVSVALPVLCLLTSPVRSQEPATPVYTQTLAYIKVAPDKAEEFRRFASEVLVKNAQVRVDAGEIATWTLLRSVYPAGAEARANYVVSTLVEGQPPAPMSAAQLESTMKKAGISMSASEFYKKRDSLGPLVALEMWRPLIRVGAPAVGHYIFINRMKVHDFPKYTEFERNVWRPLAEHWVKEKAMSGWMYAAKMLPAGSDTVYRAYSADIFPSWQAAFEAKPIRPVFEKVHAGKDYDQAMGEMTKLRSLGERELWVVVERVTKDPAARGASRTTQE